MNRLRAISAPQILLVLLVAGAVVHAVHAVRRWDDSRLALLDAVLALAALAAAAFVAKAAAPAALLAAMIVGAVGVATFLLPTMFALTSGRPLAGLFDGWGFAPLLVDALVVRIAMFALRRAQPTG